MAPRRTYLIIDDESAVAESLGHYLEDRGASVFYASDPAQGLAAFRTESIDVVISDIRMPGGSGLDLLRQIKEMSPDTAVIMITGYATPENAVAALRAGAADFLVKPIDLKELSVTLERVWRLAALERANEGYRARLLRADAESRQRHGGPTLVGDSRALAAARDLIARAAASPAAAVLVTGESGTGKELAARLVHAQSARATGPLVSVNCSGFTPSLIENELFGHERGAFTGADRMQKGVCELADGGTLFLDEIGDMPLELQGRLLRVLDDKVVRRIGGQKTIPVDFRLVSATNRDLGALVESGAFRRDLYYRLSGLEVRLPPLRDRREDVPTLARHFLALASGEQRKGVRALSATAESLLAGHDFPGNVRELKNLVETAVILADGTSLQPEHFPSLASRRPAQTSERASGGAAAADPFSTNPDDLDLKRLERETIRKALAVAGGDLRRAAKLLNIGYGALRYRLEQMGQAAAT